MMRLAFYDMDKTVTRRPTWTRFLIHAALARAPWRLALLPLAGVAGLGYLVGLGDRARLKQTSQRLLVGRACPPGDMARLAAGFAEREMRHGILAAARARIAEDRAAGYRLVLATASHGYYAAEIAKRLGFDDVVATCAQRGPNDAILHMLDGDNCYGAAKLRMIETWMERQGIDRADVRVRAYSDHVSDAPLLDWADEAFAVNAHPALAALARARGWPLLDWRS